MHPKELKLGDIIINDMDCDTLPWHVSIYTGDIDGKPHITHSINSDFGGLQTTILKNFGAMNVYRCQDTDLAQRAAARILQWSKFQIPYDTRRANWMRRTHFELRKHPKAGNQPLTYILDYLIQQSKEKFYERVKFAARRDTCPVKIVEEFPPRGFTCVQAVILAFQVEELAMYVKTLDEVKKDLEQLGVSAVNVFETWISDKHCPDEVLRTYKLPRSYLKYAANLRSKAEFPGFKFDDKNEVYTHENYHPCLVAWRYDLKPSIAEFRAGFETCIELPAKITFTEALEEYLKGNSKHWQNMGSLEYVFLPITFSPDEKALHKKRLSDLALQVAANQSSIMRERTLSTPSPRVSPRSSFYSTNSNEGVNPTPPPSRMFRRVSSLSGDEAELKTGVTSPILEQRYAKKKF